MPLSVAAKHRRRVRFPRQQQLQPTPQSEPLFIPPQSACKAPNRKRAQRQTQKQKQKQEQKQEAIPEKATMASPSVPSLFTTLPPILDRLETETSKSQSEVANKCIPFLTGEASLMPLNAWGVQRLNRSLHVAYLIDALGEYPANFVGLDASRPWMVYWAITGLYLLGEDVRQFEKRVVATAAPMQNLAGGFGGGHGQMSHCASSYALTLSLATTGGPEVFRTIDRLALWKWLGQLKQADGGFQVSFGGEEDVRGAYCAMVMIALLDIPVELPPDAPARKFGHETFLSGLPEYLSRCQTYEGGISGSPGTEAHGAYTYCAIACLCILGHPRTMINKYMNVPSLISWLSARQYSPEGGFSGRTNKLVDGCYSHWVGGCWPLIQAALDAPAELSSDCSLYSREGLTRYILGCCQSQYGGLRDKPGKHADSHHTCYILAGLSNAQHHHSSAYSEPAQADPGTGSSNGSSTEPFDAAFSWTFSPIIAAAGDSNTVYDEEDRVKPLHPLFVIPHQAAESMRAWCKANPINIPTH